MPIPDIAKKLQELATPGGKLLLAVSGGADSMALLRLVHDLGWPAEVATVDHGLRSEAEEEVDFVRQTAANLGLQFHSASFDTAAVARHRGWNMEDTARTLRYQHLAAIARAAGADNIVTAHNRDDQTETVFMQLLRGSAWLGGMPSRTGLVIRPLLHVRKQTLVQWLQEIGQDWREDASNLDSSFSRAWLRNEILPLIRARHPDLDERVANLTSLQRDQRGFVESVARPLVDLEGGIDALRLRDRPRALQLAAVALMLRAHGVPFGLERLERVAAALAEETTWREQVAPDKMLRLHYGRLEVVDTSEQPDQQSVPVTDPGQLPGGVAESALDLPDLQLRARQPGDRIRMAGGTRKLSDVLIDAKIPREERESLQVLASDGQVIWVEGVGAAHDFRAGNGAASDSHFMRAALQLAGEAGRAGELPVGAVIVRDGEIIASARNEAESSRDPTAHAELLAIRRAAELTGDWRLTGCTLYVTLEPCAMCFGAMLQAHLPTVVYAARNTREGATGSVADLDLMPWKRKVKVLRGPHGEEAAEMLTEFFRDRRNGTP